MPSRMCAARLVLLRHRPARCAWRGGQQPDYVLGPQDVFTITVWGPGGVSERFTVEADGTFTFPMLGRVKAGGLTARQLQDDLTNRLRDGYFNDPRVTVSVEEYRSQRIFVVGEVKSPGTYTLTGPMTFVEALTLAGSPTSNAGSVALVRRRTNGESQTAAPLLGRGRHHRYPRRSHGLQEGGLYQQSHAARRRHDRRAPRCAPVYVFGHVGRPGEYVIGREATVRQVLSLAGGVTQRGAAGRIKIIRLNRRHRARNQSELDDRVKPGDTIVVPERFF